MSKSTQAKARLVQSYPKEWLLDDEAIAKRKQESEAMAEDYREVRQRAKRTHVSKKTVT